MKKYMSVVRVKFLNGLQYRAAALAGIATQFAWGGLLVLLYRAFYMENADAFPMTMQQTSSYIWLQQAFLCFFASWVTDNSLFGLITSGDVAYELVRPMDLYALWYARNIGTRLARTVLRCMPILIFALLLPEPWGMTLPELNLRLVYTIISFALSLHIVVAYNMLCYAATFWTMSALGVRIMFQTLADVFGGGLVPIPFMPAAVRRIIALSPFATMQDIPLRIYSGSIADADIFAALGQQAFWLCALTALGVYLFRRAGRRIVLQGG